MSNFYDSELRDGAQSAATMYKMGIPDVEIIKYLRKVYGFNEPQAEQCLRNKQQFLEG